MTMRAAWASETGPAGTPASFEDVVGQAQTLAGQDYKARPAAGPGDLAELSYEQYQDIRFRREHALWIGQELGFEVDLFHPGFRFMRPVDIYNVNETGTHPVALAPEMFDYGPRVNAPSAPEGLSFTGFRARYPLNAPDRIDEFAVFQGGTRFRAVGSGQRYGVSARGLAIATADAEGEEFPDFTAFWLMKPVQGDSTMTVLALMDSPSITGAYRFQIRPGESTVIDVDTALFPRRQVTKIGLGPLTSMFLYDSSSRAGYDDFRTSVHNSDGLQMLTGNGERIFRPLANPSRLQLSAFLDTNPRGFGLVQRSRRFSDFQDMDARFDLRPSTWVEPVGEWGTGSVVLVEIPTEAETNDNIVAYWRPSAPFEPGTRTDLSYRMHFCSTPPDNVPLARVAATRGGRGGDGRRRLFVLDFVGLPASERMPHAEVSQSNGVILNVTTRPNPVDGSYRLSFEVDPGDESLVELRALLVGDSGPVSETWLYRWTSA
ncbi:glucan biosynthesis protein [Thalassobaculum sp. OXR-137]|uniref:glucan biosynthesis protein n=1 Tax=Thalassobaculum sp. OXR-137 TaxID=3100173 RepID=UPI002AC8AE20|nr:glucan biosynthesis protein [Thalassobaculum sp. OXR-137]WPZ34461.1 glucan biosynthesis protein [Thalassobaculum sp. OXR-137]